MKTIILLFALFFSTFLSAGYFEEQNKSWKTINTIEELTFIGLCVIDMRQTLWMQKQKAPANFNYFNSSYYSRREEVRYNSWFGHEESNPILGKFPSKNKIKLYFGTVFISHLIIMYVLPERYKDLFAGFTIGIETYVIKHNYDRHCTAEIKCKF